MTAVQRYLTSTMSDRDLKAVYTLLWKVWPGQNSFEEAFAGFKNRILENTKNLGDRHRFVRWEGNQAVAHASIFPREIHTEGGSVRVGALSAVCTHPDFRGQGLGAEVVRAAFGLVENGMFPVSLWMTSVPSFYEKLGARIVENTWINSQDTGNPAANPWPDEQKMIYPASFDWPAGQIDLNGSAY